MDVIASCFLSEFCKVSALSLFIKKKLSFFEGGHQLEKLEFALAIAQTKGDEKKSIVLRKKIVELGGNVEEPGT